MKTLIALTISGLFATTAMAGEITKATDVTDKVAMEANSKFIKLDVDSDANLTKTEITLDDETFIKADINLDGKLNHDEFVAWYKTEDMSKQYSSAPVEEEPMNNDKDEEQDDKE
jgi:hypothetical protein